MQELNKYVEKYFGIHNRELEKVAQRFTESTIKKNECILKTGAFVKHMHFVKSGYFRIYAPDTSLDKEITQWISSPGEFLTDLSGLVFNTPSRWTIDAITDAELYSIPKEDYLRLAEIVPNWKELEKLFIAKCFVHLENRMFAQLSLSAEDKYRELFERNPGLFNSVPLQYIASMLGMTPETFSRVRKKMIS